LTEEKGNMDEPRVRIATPEDIARCMDLFVQANEENGIEALDEQKLLSIVWPSLHQDGGLIGIIGETGAEPEGVVLLRIETLWYSNAPVIAEKLVFVHPNYRSAKGARARKLCEFSKKVSDEMGLPLIIGVVSTDRTKGKVRLYERVFGMPAGAFFLYNGKTGLPAGENG
jgi:hypothetical protein